MFKFMFLGLIPAALAENYTFPTGFKLDAVDSTTKSSWCQAQMNTCPELCGGGYSVNLCTVDTLEYNCTCDDGAQPDVSKYRLTVPFFVCEDAFRQCIDAHPNDRFGQKRCLDEEKTCPSKDPASSVSHKYDDQNEDIEEEEDEAESPTPKASSTKPSEQHRAQPTTKVEHSGARALCAGGPGAIVLLTGLIMVL